MPGKDLSELESFVLGLVWQLGPCSPYELRMSMQRSPSTQWSASAGAIYPLVARLVRRGLLKGRAKRAGRRARREYTLTARGRKKLTEWVGPPFSREAVTVSYDPLRSRARFLGVLSATERGQWIASAREALDEVERHVRRWDETAADSVGPAAALMTSSGLRDVASRREWLADVARLVV